MAFHMNFHLNEDMLNNNNVFDQHFVRITPVQIHQQMPNFQYDNFEGVVGNRPFFPYGENHIQREFHLQQYYIRYLIMCNRVNDARNCIEYMNNHMHHNQNAYIGVNVNNIVNYCHHNFNGTSLLHFALQWGAATPFIQWMINYGADINVEDNDGFLPGDNINLVPWNNPFAPYFNMQHVWYYNGRIAVRDMEDFDLDWYFQHVGEEPMDPNNNNNWYQGQGQNAGDGDGNNNDDWDGDIFMA